MLRESITQKLQADGRYLSLAIDCSLGPGIERPPVKTSILNRKRHICPNTKRARTKVDISVPRWQIFKFRTLRATGSGVISTRDIDLPVTPNNEHE